MGLNELNQGSQQNQLGDSQGAVVKRRRTLKENHAKQGKKIDVRPVVTRPTSVQEQLGSRWQERKANR